MYKNLLSWLTVLVLFPSCSKTPPNISVVCEENNVGNCIIKWETAPLILSWEERCGVCGVGVENTNVRTGTLEPRG